MRMILKVMLNLIVPPRCPISGTLVDETGQLYSAVWNDIHFISAPYCKICGVPFSADMGADDDMVCAPCLKHPPQYDNARAGVVYDDITRQLVLRYKHGDHLYLTRSFVPWIESGASDVIALSDVIIPVPLHWTRLMKRRYNQSALLAKDIAARHMKVYDPFLLKRVKATPPQGKRGVKERYNNVKKAFFIPEKKRIRLEGKTVLLIDDVMTSGATVNECAKTLKAHGARAVYVAAIARAVKQ